MEPSGSAYVRQLAASQESSYRHQPIELISHGNHESAVKDAYRGRQILELLQNADDAGAEYSSRPRLLLRLVDRYLIAANTGRPFSPEGIRSLVISDVSPKRFSRRRLIGNKGLGFRAVLSWSTEPIILSGDFLVGFSSKLALRRARELANSLPELNEEFGQMDQAAGHIRVPTMRFPFVPSIYDANVQMAIDIRAEGYDTVVLLPLIGGPRAVLVKEDILAQLEAIRGDT